MLPCGQIDPPECHPKSRPTATDAIELQMECECEQSKHQHCCHPAKLGQIGCLPECLRHWHFHQNGGRRNCQCKSYPNPSSIGTPIIRMIGLFVLNKNIS